MESFHWVQSDLIGKGNEHARILNQPLPRKKLRHRRVQVDLLKGGLVGWSEWDLNENPQGRELCLMVCFESMSCERVGVDSLRSVLNFRSLFRRLLVLVVWGPPFVVVSLVSFAIVVVVVVLFSVFEFTALFAGVIIIS